MNQRISTIVALAVIAGLLFPLSAVLWTPPAGTALTAAAAGDPPRMEVARILERKCLICHARGDWPLPWYASLPVAGRVIQHDIALGIERFDMLAAFAPTTGMPGDSDASPADSGAAPTVPLSAEPVGEAPLAKLEQVTTKGSMPPLPYLLLHWNAFVVPKERDAILSWIESVRRAHYATPGVAEEFAGDVLQPLPEPTDVDPGKVALGRQLFHDTRLSADNTLSCASCHALDKGGTDQLPTSTGINGAVGPINSPTVFNARWQFAQFWDGREPTLEAQAAGPVHNPIEMGSDWKAVIGKLEQDEAFVAAFRQEYPDGLTGDNLTHAIAEFERSLVTVNSPFDRYLRGAPDALSPEAKRGLALFKRAGCATCHVGKLLGGQSYERLGVVQDYFKNRGNVQEADYGRYNVTRDEADLHRFKVPTLRNIEVTHPYLHDASAATLADAVAVMAQYQTGFPLFDQEILDIVEFLKSLTGEYEGQRLN